MSTDTQVVFANSYTSVECQNPINWNFLLENPAVGFFYVNSPITHFFAGSLIKEDHLRHASKAGPGRQQLVSSS